MLPRKESCTGQKTNGLIQCIQVERTFKKVLIDILGPFSLSKRGNGNIIVSVDYQTKWAELRAMPTEKTEDVAEFFIEQIILRHLEQIITDRGYVLLQI